MKAEAPSHGLLLHFVRDLGTESCCHSHRTGLFRKPFYTTCVLQGYSFPWVWRQIFCKRNEELGHLKAGTILRSVFWSTWNEIEMGFSEPTNVSVAHANTVLFWERWRAGFCSLFAGEQQAWAWQHTPVSARTPWSELHLQPSSR